MKDKIQASFAKIQADDALISNTKIYLRKETEKRRGKRKAFQLPARVGAVAAMAMLAVGILSCNLYFTAFAHISIDVNPSVELTLNRFDRVIDTHAFNEDGADILSGADLRGKTCDEAAMLLLSAIEANGYIRANALVSVTVQAASGEKEQSLCEAMLKSLNDKALPIQATAEVEVFPVSSEVWGNARGCHMSPARYLAIQELLEVDEAATIEDYSDTSIGQIRRRTQECGNRHNTEPAEPVPQNEQGQVHKQEHGQGNGHGYRGGRH